VLAGHVALTEEVQNTHRSLVGKIEETNDLKHAGIAGRIISNFI
jgi:hypothetical protein